MMTGSTPMLEILGLSPVIPVITIEDIETAIPLAEALVAGGLRVLEITMRTPVALDAARLIASEVSGAVVGVGTVLTPAHYAQACAAGARFAVSPGVSDGLLAAVAAGGAPLLPGAATATEAMSLAEKGFTCLKFFPAEPAGGVAYLKSLGEPLQDLKFCPTGGITLARAPDYLALKNVVCVGGSWIMPKDAIARRDWASIETLAREASELRPRA